VLQLVPLPKLVEENIKYRNFCNQINSRESTTTFRVSQLTNTQTNHIQNITPAKTSRSKYWTQQSRRQINSIQQSIPTRSSRGKHRNYHSRRTRPCRKTGQQMVSWQRAATYAWSEQWWLPTRSSVSWWTVPGTGARGPAPGDTPPGHATFPSPDLTAPAGPKHMANDKWTDLI